MHDPFVGVWSLMEYVLIREDGVIRRPWGDAVSGLLVYTPEGYMSANLMPTPRRAPAAHPQEPAATDEKTRRAARYIGYAGRYSVSGNTITHHVDVSLFPSWVGLPQVRYFKVSAERLTLSTPPIPRLGKPLVGQLLWKRVK